MGIFFILLEPSFIPAEFIWKYLSRTRAQPSGSRAKVRSSKVSAPAIFQKKNRRKRCVACDELAERVGFLFLRETPRRLRRATGAPLRAAFRIPPAFMQRHLSRTRAQPSGSRAKVRSSKVSAPAIFQKKSPQAMRSLRRTGGAGGIRTHGRFHPSNDFESFSL